ncbi:GNAT family N-acetyltransferase [Sphingomonas oleivorans]|uniref:GNAT family N-acetyltransferase n=1 Tax=Sphingomonas oleivorans TaxID=1735121 RepID=A0A2T5G0Q9_9SPHN|nr:GNAT family N-acetyltransferase [Sphingomonas oleivorans]PTQ12701.1 GNAT family N-acetyltransferase [Sphingomonas oleivorans]
MATVPEPDSRLRLRAMTSADLAAAQALSKAEQWPHRLEDWEMLLALGDGVVAVEGDTVVGTTMWWPCGPKAATIGMVIVSRDHRGAGIGRMLMETALAATKAESQMLNSTEEGEPLYRKLGFEPVGEILQHQGAAFSVPIIPLETGERIRPLGTSDWEAVAAMTEAATGLTRPALLAELQNSAHGVILDEDGRQAGFALFRRFGRGYSVGPVVAPDIVRAKALISHWLGSQAGKFTRLDIPGDSGLSAWLEDLGIVRVGRVVTMLRGKPLPATGDMRSFAIVTQALG